MLDGECFARFIAYTLLLAVPVVAAWVYAAVRVRRARRIMAEAEADRRRAAEERARAEALSERLGRAVQAWKRG